MSLEEFLLRFVVASASHTTSAQMRDGDGYKRTKLGPAGIFVYAARFTSWRNSVHEYIHRSFDHE